MRDYIKKHSKILMKKIEKTKKKIKLEFFIFLFFVLLILLISYTFYPQIKEFIHATISIYGFVAIFVISYLSDIILQPVAPDVPIIFGIFFGLDPILVTLTAILASTLATITGYYLGVLLGASGFLRFYGRKKYKKVKKMYLKYNLIIPLAAVSPVPYVPICWISGMFKMNVIRFFLYAMVPRSFRLIIIALSAYVVFY